MAQVEKDRCNLLWLTVIRIFCVQCIYTSKATFMSIRQSTIIKISSFPVLKRTYITRIDRLLIVIASKT